MAILRADTERAQPDARDAGGAAPRTPELTKATDQLIALIPAEAIALFILLIGLLADEKLGWRLAALGVVVLFAIGWIFVSFWEARGGRVGAPTPAFEIGVGVVAFLAWSTSVPASPFTDLDLPTWAGPVLVAIVSGALVMAARARALWTAGAAAPQPRARDHATPAR